MDQTLLSEEVKTKNDYLVRLKEEFLNHKVEEVAHCASAKELCYLFFENKYMD